MFLESRAPRVSWIRVPREEVQCEHAELLADENSDEARADASLGVLLHLLGWPPDDRGSEP